MAKLTIVIASKGQTLTQIPHPLQISSSICAFFVSSFSTMQSAPDLFTGTILDTFQTTFFWLT